MSPLNYKNINVKKLSKPLCIDKFRYKDIKQGNLGTCWFLSALAVYLKKDINLSIRRKKLESLIKYIGDDEYSIKLNNIYYIVDLYVPINYDDSNYEVIWPILFEKAMLSYMTGRCTSYKKGVCCTNIKEYKGENNSGSLALNLITGYKSAYKNIHKHHNKQINSISQSELISLFNNGEFILANTNNETFQIAPRKVQQLNAIRHHCYAILNIFEKNGEIYLTMYNPWGSDGMTEQSCSIEYGEFTISWDIFRITFSIIHHTIISYH